MPLERLSAALSRVTIVSRGPKPVGILKALAVPIHVIIPEPNTWKEIVGVVANRYERRIAVQEYGRANLEMNQALERLGAAVTSVVLYRWELPDNLEPLQEAARRLVCREFDVVLFTSSIQLDHLLQVSRSLGLEPQVRSALLQSVVASIGPVMTEALQSYGRPPDVVPRHPKMWALVKAASEEAAGVIEARNQSLRER
jgi:uroporphyrinogen-III synthase